MFQLQEGKNARNIQSLDDFLSIRGHFRRQEDAMAEAELRAEPLSSERGATMWKGLITVTRDTAMRVVKIDGVPFGWDDGPPFGKSRSPLLRLEPVGAQFKELRSRPFVGASRSCVIVFGWVATLTGSRKQTPPDRYWTLTLSSNSGQLTWNINDDDLVDFSTGELAEQIVKQLIEYRDEYERA